MGVEDKLKNVINNINYNQKYPSEKRSFRVNEVKINYENDISSMGEEEIIIILEINMNII